MNPNLLFFKKPLSSSISEPKIKEEPNIHQHSMIGDIELVKTLNYGVTSRVKLGIDKNTKKEYAVKIIKKEYEDLHLQTMEQEAKFVELLSKENHPNIVKFVYFLPKADYTKRNGQVKKVSALVLEYAKGGNLFECLSAMSSLKEDIARTYFQQLLDTLESLHENGIVHRDIKPDNLLLNEDFQLKLADFNLSQYILSSEDSSREREQLSTSSYLAPEVLSQKNYVLQSIDLFSCGVILFLMVTGFPPFVQASNQDLHYKFIMKSQYSKFWSSVEKRKVKVSPEFKDLINNLLCFEPTERLTLPEIKYHPWYNGKTCSVKELKQEYETKKEEFRKIQQQKAKQFQQQKQLKELKKRQIESKIIPSVNCYGINGLNNKNRGGSMDSLPTQELHLHSSDSMESYEITQKDACEYIDTGYHSLTESFYPIDHGSLYKILLLIQGKIFNTFKSLPNECKIKGRVLSESSDYSGQMVIQVSKVDENSSCLTYTRITGPLLSFYKFLEESLKPEIDNHISYLESYGEE